MKQYLNDIGEFGLIDKIQKQIKLNSSVIKGIGDDAAVVKVSANKHLLFTTDMLIEGVHFTCQMSAIDIGRKSIACSISDIAAMGGVPRHIVVSFGAPPRTKLDFTLGILKGMNCEAEKYGACIVGGDTVKSDKVVINVAMTGEVGKKAFVSRGGAKKGDSIFVTGPLGNSLKSGRHLKFTPRIKESQYLVKNFKPTSMIDISDGLAQDLSHILRESKVGAFISDELIPKNSGAAIDNALYDGEDFELLFTLSKRDAGRLIKSRGFKCYLIGEITDKKTGLVLVDKKGNEKKIKAKGFTHF